MTHHLQCKLPTEAAWCTIATSHATATEAEAKLRSAWERYEALGVLDPSATWRIVEDDKFVSGPLAFMTLCMFVGALAVGGMLLTGH
jgi:hypothetical protein